MTREEIEAVVVDELEFLIRWELQQGDNIKDEELLAALRLVLKQYEVKQ
jgi:hypothetical protein